MFIMPSMADEASKVGETGFSFFCGKLSIESGNPEGTEQEVAPRPWSLWRFAQQYHVRCTNHVAPEARPPAASVGKAAASLVSFARGLRDKARPAEVPQYSRETRQF